MDNIVPISKNEEIAMFISNFTPLNLWSGSWSGHEGEEHIEL